MKNLKLYYIDEEYINYLRQFDKNVAYNKTSTRPYIGVVYTYNNYNYFAPLSSPKPKHININPKAVDIFKIKNGELGVVNINNMIPTPIENLTEVLPTVNDKKYKKLLEQQLTFLNNHKAELYKKINYFTIYLFSFFCIFFFSFFLLFYFFKLKLQFYFTRRKI